LRRLDTHFSRILHNFFVSVPNESHRRSTPAIRAALLAQPLSTLRVSSALIDNNVTSATPWLNPFAATSRTWAIAFWRAWWTQDPTGCATLSAPST